MREFVADVGNTRIKWGMIASEELFRSAAVPPDDPDRWAQQLDDWQCMRPLTWTLAGTNPAARDRLSDWLVARGNRVRIIDCYQQIPLAVKVDHPEQIGIDRLLNAVAVLPKVPRGTPIAIVCAGSAVTVDLVDAEGAFRGGAIFPGFRLMAKSLNDYTAKLPLVDTFAGDPPLPGVNTVEAIDAGITHAIRGGVERMIARYAKSFGPPHVFIAGGDAERLIDLNCQTEMAGPYLTLEGIRIVTQGLP